MPTSHEETKFIASILDQYINEAPFHSPLECKRLLTKDLAEKIGFKTENYSVRHSLFSLCQHYSPGWKIPDLLVTSLIDRWRSDTSLHDIALHDFVGMDAEDFELYCSNKYYQ